MHFKYYKKGTSKKAVENYLNVMDTKKANDFLDGLIKKKPPVEEKPVQQLISFAKVNKSFINNTSGVRSKINSIDEKNRIVFLTAFKSDSQKGKNGIGTNIRELNYSLSFDAINKHYENQLIKFI